MEHLLCPPMYGLPHIVVPHLELDIIILIIMIPTNCGCPAMIIRRIFCNYLSFHLQEIFLYLNNWLRLHDILAADAVSQQLCQPPRLVKGSQVTGTRSQPGSFHQGVHLGGVLPVEVEEGVLHRERGGLLCVQLAQQLSQVVVLVRYNELVQVLSQLWIKVVPTISTFNSPPSLHTSQPSPSSGCSRWARWTAPRCELWLDFSEAAAREEPRPHLASHSDAAPCPPQAPPGLNNLKPY